jgi:hypothetical protein
MVENDLFFPVFPLRTQRPLRFKILQLVSLGRAAGVHCILLFSYS